MRTLLSEEILVPVIIISEAPNLSCYNKNVTDKKELMFLNAIKPRMLAGGIVPDEESLRRSGISGYSDLFPYFGLSKSQNEWNILPSKVLDPNPSDDRKYIIELEVPLKKLFSVTRGPDNPPSICRLESIYRTLNEEISEAEYTNFLTASFKQYQYNLQRDPESNESVYSLFWEFKPAYVKRIRSIPSIKNRRVIVITDEGEDLYRKVRSEDFHLIVDSHIFKTTDETSDYVFDLVTKHHRENVVCFRFSNDFINENRDALIMFFTDLRKELSWNHMLDNIIIFNRGYDFFDSWI